MPRKAKTSTKESSVEPLEKTSADQEALGFVKSMLAGINQQASSFLMPTDAKLANSVESAPLKEDVPAILKDAFQQIQQLIQSCTYAQKRLEKERETFIQGQNAVEQKQSELEKEKQVLQAKQKTLDKKEAEFIIIERSLAEREANAAANFIKQNKQAIENLNQQVLDLTLEYQQLQKKILSEKTRCLEQWEQERQKAQKIFEESLEEERKKFLARLANEEQNLRQQQQQLLQQRQIFEEECRKIELELRKRENKIKILEEILKEDQKSLEQKIELKVNEEAKRLKLELNSAREFNRIVQEECKKLETQIHSYQELNVKLGNREPEEILKEIKKKDQEIQKLRNELSERPGENITQQMEILKQEYDSVRDQLNTITKQYLQAKNQLDHTIVNAMQEQNLREINRMLEIRCSGMASNLAKLEEEVQKYKKFTDLPKERSVRIGVIEDPIYKIKRDPPNNKSDEFEWLQQIYEEMKHCGFYFSKRLLYAFHTSLKTVEWSSLTVLTGVSGTGKSELPRLYARFGGVEFESIAVQPNWDSPQDLFGFFNYMDNRFNAKPLLRGMVQSQLPKEKGGFNDGLLVVLLDEMNLARVEQYFSDLLSKLELRRGETQTVYLNVDLGSGLEPYSVPLGKNVFFVGTINEDESTQTLSDKALDRSNVIAFPSPTQFRSREILQLSERKGFLNFNVWQSWLRDPLSLRDDIRNRLKVTVEEINRCLIHVGRALGHRVWQGMENYIANHPEVCKAAKELRLLKEPAKGTAIEAKVVKEKTSSESAINNQLVKLQDACQRAFEDQIVQKIMPKLRGIETSEGNARKFCLDPIAEILRKEAIGLLEDYQNACEKTHGTFLWHTAKYLENENEE